MAGELSDLETAITQLADASYESGRCDARDRHQIGAAMVFYSRSDELRTLIARAERIGSAARDLCAAWHNLRAVAAATTHGPPEQDRAPLLYAVHRVCEAVEEDRDADAADR